MTDSAFWIRSDYCEQEQGWDKESSQLSRSLDNMWIWCQGFPADMEFCIHKRPGGECVAAAWPTCFWNLQWAPAPQWLWMCSSKPKSCGTKRVSIPGWKCKFSVPNPNLWDQKTGRNRVTAIGVSTIPQGEAYIERWLLWRALWCSRWETMRA